MTTHSDEIVNFITAVTPMGLRRMMFLNNSKKGTMFHYFDIQQFTNEQRKTMWIAWYYEKVTSQEFIDNDTSQN